MAKPVTEILPKKIKKSAHLLNKIQQKHPHLHISQCVLLLGSGCSYPTIPLGSGITEICQKLCYMREIFPVKAASSIDDFLKNGDISKLDTFINTATNDNPKAKKIEKYIKDIEKNLHEAISKRKGDELNKITPFIKDAEWDDFEKHIINDAKYGFWLDEYNNSPRERQRLIEALIEGKNAGGAYIILAFLIQEKYFSNILTTNFDDFINDAILNYTSARPKFYADDELSQYISIYGKNPNIIKLHGDYRYANIKNTSDETFQLSASMKNKLKELLDHLDIIVLGYSGADYSIMSVLKEVNSPNCELIWCGLDEKNVHWRVANLINTCSNSWFIPIKGFDDLIKEFYLNFEPARPDLRKIADERQKELDTYIDQYFVKVKESSTDAEKESLDKLAEIEKLLQKGRNFYWDKKYDEAIISFSKIIDLDENNFMAWLWRGSSFIELKQYDKAIEDLNKAIELDENFSIAYNNRGYAYNELKQYDKAIEDLTKAIELGQLSAPPHKHLASTYLQLKDNKKALQEVNTAIELKEDYWKAYELRADIYEAMGKTEEAKKDRELVEKNNDE